MTHRKGAIWTERVLLALILCSLVGSLNLIVALHRRSAFEPSGGDANSTTAQPSPIVSSQPIAQNAAPIASSSKDEEPADAPIVRQADEPIPSPPPVDPTQKIVASLASATAQELEASRLADRRSVSLEQARLAAVAESTKWKRRELLVRQQIASLNKRAEDIETSASLLDAERDVLAHERDALKAALSKASRRSGFAVLPYKGPNGTWRRPIVLECTSSGVKLQPKGQNFTAMELSPYLHPRSSPFVQAIAHELLHIQSSDTPDGAAVVPYLVFLVRPNGIRPYYEARTRLEPLGIAFGYELIEQDLAVDIPDFDNLMTWDGSVPLDMPLEKAPQATATVAMLSTPGQGASKTSTESPNWPAADSSSRGGSAWGSNPPSRQAAAGSDKGESGTPQDFVWPSRPRQIAELDLPGAASSDRDSFGDPSKRPSAGSSGTGLGLGQPSPLGGRDANPSSLAGQQPWSGGASGLGDSPSPGAPNPPSNPAGTSRVPGVGSGSRPAISGSGPAQGAAGQPSGPGSELAGAGGLPSLPDLEPAGDALTSQPNQPQGGASPGQSNSAGAGGGGRFFSPGGGVAGGAADSTGNGSGQSGPAGTGGGGQLLSPGGGVAGVGANSTGNGSGQSGPTGTGSGGQLLGLGGGVAGVGANSTGNGSGQSGPTGTGSGGQFLSPGGAQAGGGVPSTGGSRSSSSSSSATNGEDILAFTPYQGATGVASTAGSGSTLNAGGGTVPNSALGQGSNGGAGQNSALGQGSNGGAGQNSALGQGSNGGDPPAGGGSSTAAIASDLPSLPQIPNAGSPPDNPQPLPDPDTASGSVASAGATNPPPQGSNLGSGSVSGSSTAATTLSGAGLPPSTGSSSSSGSPTTTASSSTTSSSVSSSASASSGTSFGSPPPSGMPSVPMPTFTFGQNSGSASDSKQTTPPPLPKPAPTMGSIEVPFEIVVVCRAGDLLLHPGGYRLTTQAMKEQRGGKDGLLVREIRALVIQRAQVDPMIRPKPRIKFLVESNGSETFWTARRQLLFSLSDWPMSLQVAESQSVHVFNKETW